MRTMYILRTDDRPTDRSRILQKISNGHMSGTDHPIHFIFGSRAGFSRSVDQVTLLAVLDNLKWRPAAILENVEWPRFCNGSCNSLYVWFYGRVFGSTDRMSLYFRLDHIQDHGRQPSCIIFNGHISETVHPVQYVFGSSVKQEKIMREE